MRLKLKPLRTFIYGPFIYATYRFPKGIYTVVIGVEL